MGAAHHAGFGAPRTAAMATGTLEAEGPEMPLKEALHFARSSNYRCDSLRGPRDHTWRRSMARGSRPPGNGTKRPFVVQRELFLISKMWVFFLLKKEIEKYAFPSAHSGCGPAGPERRGGPCPGAHACSGRSSRGSCAHLPAIRWTAGRAGCRSHAARSEPKAECRSAPVSW